MQIGNKGLGCLRLFRLHILLVGELGGLFGLRRVILPYLVGKLVKSLALFIVVEVIFHILGLFKEGVNDLPLGLAFAVDKCAEGLPEPHIYHGHLHSALINIVDRLQNVSLSLEIPAVLGSFLHKDLAGHFIDVVLNLAVNFFDLIKTGHNAPPFLSKLRDVFSVRTYSASVFRTIFFTAAGYFVRKR